MYAMTCAHSSFEFGTKFRVTLPVNNKTVIVIAMIGDLLFADVTCIFPEDLHEESA